MLQRGLPHTAAEAGAEDAAPIEGANAEAALASGGFPQLLDYTARDERSGGDEQAGAWAEILPHIAHVDTAAERLKLFVAGRHRCAGAPHRW